MPFEEMLNRYAKDVLLFVRSRVTYQDADDVFQEVMIQALKSYPSLREPSRAKAWLFQIANHKVIDHFRKQERVPLPTEATPEDDAAPAQKEIWESVRELPERERQTVTLRFMADLTHREIGEVLGITEAAARRACHDGLKRLRESHKPAERNV